MTSSSSSSSRGFSSPRLQRRLLWISAAVFVVGVAAILAVTVFRGNSNNTPPVSTQKAQVAAPNKTVPPSPAAYAVARKFLETAPARTNLDEAYSLVTSALKGGITRKQWDSGSIPVTPYPARNAATSHFQVDWSYQKQLMLEVTLVAKKGSGVRPQLEFFLGLVRSGDKWLVNYFQPHFTEPVPESPTGP